MSEHTQALAPASTQLDATTGSLFGLYCLRLHLSGGDNEDGLLHGIPGGNLLELKMISRLRNYPPHQP
jgi:hypothetical protein